MDDPIYSGLGLGMLKTTRKSVNAGMHPEPLRAAPDAPNGLKKPAWVDNLVDNVEQIFKARQSGGSLDKVGVRAIQKLFDDTDTKINGDRALRNKPGVPDSVAVLRSYTDQSYSFGDKNTEDRALRTTKWEPRWEKDLKKYIKGLIGQYGKSHLDDYVRPVVSAIESSNDIDIRDIDVNPYGEVSVNWKPNKEVAARSRYDEQVRPEMDPYFNEPY